MTPVEPPPDRLGNPTGGNWPNWPWPPVAGVMPHGSPWPPVAGVMPHGGKPELWPTLCPTIGGKIDCLDCGASGCKRDGQARPGNHYMEGGRVWW